MWQFLPGALPRTPPHRRNAFGIALDAMFLNFCFAKMRNIGPLKRAAQNFRFFPAKNFGRKKNIPIRLVQMLHGFGWGYFYQ